MNSLLELIGHTPLLRLSTSLGGPDGSPDGDWPDDGPLVLAKIEYLNPGGSVKDRIAERMIEAVGAWRDAGVDEIIVPDFTLGTGSERQERLDTIIETIAPGFR